MPVARTMLPLQMVFALNALGLAVWFPRIPDVKEALGLDVLTLAFCLFAMPVGTMLGFLLAGGSPGSPAPGAARGSSWCSSSPASPSTPGPSPRRCWSAA
ncbi:MAG TPA: hypothetical protein VM891_09665 [Amaricoccus sp.]|nr:hypothetical protein [Amaricoccus sp.]